MEINILEKTVIKTVELGQRIKTVKYNDREYSIMEYYLYDQYGNESTNEFLDNMNIGQIFVQSLFEGDLDETMEGYYQSTLSMLSKSELIEMNKNKNKIIADYYFRNVKPEPLL